MNKLKLMLILIISICMSSFFNMQLQGMEDEDQIEIELITKESEKFQVRRVIAEEYLKLIKDMLDEQDEDEEEETLIPIPNVTSQDFRLIQELMQKAWDERNRLDEIPLKGELAKIIRKKKWLHRKRAELFRSLDYLNAPLLLNALVFYLIDTDPRQYLQRENPLDLNEIQNMFYKKYIKDNFNDFIIYKASRLGFYKWFNKVKVISGFPERIAKVIWKLAEQKVEEEDINGLRQFFNTIPEENLLKMALRIAYNNKTGELLDIIDVKKLNFQESLITKKFQDPITFEEEETNEYDILICDLKLDFGKTGLDNDRVINMFLYLIAPFFKEDKKIHIYLTGDNLKVIPDAIYLCNPYIKELIVLSLTGNKLTKIPYFLTKMKSLKSFGFNEYLHEKNKELIKKLKEKGISVPPSEKERRKFFEALLFG